MGPRSGGVARQGLRLSRHRPKWKAICVPSRVPNSPVPEPTVVDSEPALVSNLEAREVVGSKRRLEGLYPTPLRRVGYVVPELRHRGLGVQAIEVVPF